MTRWPIGALLRDEDNPNLGSGHLLDLDEAGRGQVAFLSNPDMYVDLNRRPLRRQRLPVGARVCLLDPDRGEAEGVIEATDFEGEGLYIYKVRVDGELEEIEESEIYPLGPDGESPQELLEGRAWRGPFHFIARQNACAALGEWGEVSEGLPALIGGRCSLDPRAVTAIREILAHPKPKGVLFGGTPESRRITAGLFAQVFLSEFPDSRALIIAPGALLDAWQRSMSINFGGHAFTIANPREPESFTGDRVLLSHNVLRNSMVQEILEEERFTLLLVQQAHTISAKSPIYDFLVELIGRTPVVLAQGAAPSDADYDLISGFLGLLSAPEPPHAPEVVKAYSNAYAPIWRGQAALAEAIEAGADTSGLGGPWAKAKDPALLERVGRIGDAPEDTLSYSRTHHRFEPRLISLSPPSSTARPLVELIYEPSVKEKVAVDYNDFMPPLRARDPAARLLLGQYRLAVAGSPEAALDLLSARRMALGGRPTKGRGGPALTEALLLDPSPAEADAIFERLLNDCPALDSEVEWLGAQIEHLKRWKDENADGIARHLAAARWIGGAGRGRVVAFARTPASVEAFAASLRRMLPNIGVVAVHHKLTQERVARTLREFRQKQVFRVLITDDDTISDRGLGPIQHILHLEPPATCARGLRRASWAHPTVEAVTLRASNGFEEALHGVHRAAGIYQRAMGLAERQQITLERAILTGMARDLSGAEAAAAGLDAAREAASLLALGHDVNPAALERVEEQCEMIDDTSEELQRRDTRYFTDWAQTLGIRARREEARVTYGWTLNALRRPLWRLGQLGEPTPVESPVKFPHGTFDREVALERESLQYFAPGHRFVDALLDDLLESPHGRAAVFSRDLGEAHAGRIYAVVLLRLAADLDELPQGLALVARSRLWPRWTLACFDLNGEAPVSVEDGELEALLTLEQRKRAQKIEPEALMDLTDLPTLWAKVEAASALARVEGAAEIRPEAEEAAEALREGFVDELDRLNWRREAGDDVEAAAAAARIEQVEAAATALASAGASVDALAVIVGAQPSAE